MLLFQGSTDLLRSNLVGDALIPTDDVLQALGDVVRVPGDPDAWRVGLRKLLLAQDDRAALREHLAGVQFLASVGTPRGARLLAGLWQQAELGLWTDAMAGCRELETLLDLVVARGREPLELDPLAGGVLRAVSLAHQLKASGLRKQGMDLLTATSLVQTNHGHGQVVIAVEADLAAGIEACLAAPARWDENFAGSLEGVSLFEGLLVIDLDPPETAASFRDGFPALVPGAPGDEDEAPPAPAATAEEETDEAAAKAIENSQLKKLVLDNIMSTSVLLEFLRDAKVTSIPGLVEEIVNRTRNPQVIETIINDRRLHTGFANKGVPLACLRSPVNVSIKQLRKFVHVKYVSKVDLKRLANDRTGVRKEVGREIERYLAALA